jgi:hypothetical protein
MCIDFSQFLPQDRVAHFAQLSPTALLHETQRAVGGDEMVNHWERLCTLRREEVELKDVLTPTPHLSLEDPLYVSVLASSIFCIYMLMSRKWSTIPKS